MIEKGDSRLRQRSSWEFPLKFSLVPFTYRSQDGTISSRRCLSHVTTPFAVSMSNRITKSRDMHASSSTVMVEMGHLPDNRGRIFSIWFGDGISGIPAEV